MKPKVLIEVSGGVAYVMAGTAEVEVVIADHDNREDTPKGEKYVPLREIAEPIVSARSFNRIVRDAAAGKI